MQTTDKRLQLQEEDEDDGRGEMRYPMKLYAALRKKRVVVNYQNRP